MISLKYSRRLGRWVFIATTLTLSLYFLYRVRIIMPPFILAIVLAYVLNPMVRFLEVHRISRTRSILLVYIFLGTIITLVGVYFIPLLIRELNTFADAFPLIVDSGSNLMDDLNDTYRKIAIPESIRQALNESLESFQQLIVANVRQIAEDLLNLLSGLLSLVISPILAFYILQDLRHLEKKILRWLPQQYRKNVLKLWRQIDNVLVGFVKGHLLVASIVGLLTGIGLKILNVKFPLILGIVAGISDLIPYFGPIIGGIPAVALALLQSQFLALYVIILMIIIQQLESNFISPKILGGSVGLHPVVVVFVLLAGGYLYGIVGMIVAVPLTAILRLVFNFLYALVLGQRWY